jgi:hypothetical protein
VNVVGEPRDVAPRDPDSDYADYHGQLIDLGFEPLGVFQESLPGASADKEYVLVHRRRNCRASIYALGGGPPRVCLKSDTADGRLVATFNYGDEELEQDTVDYIDWRHPTHSMEELLDEHEDARFSWVDAGAALVAPRTIEEAAALETRNFFNDSVRCNFLCVLISFMLWGLPFVAVFSAGAAWLLPGHFWRVFSLCVIAFTGMGYLLEKRCDREAFQETTIERDGGRVPLEKAAVA